MSAARADQGSTRGRGPDRGGVILVTAGSGLVAGAESLVRLGLVRR